MVFRQGSPWIAVANTNESTRQIMVDTKQKIDELFYFQQIAQAKQASSLFAVAGVLWSAARKRQRQHCATLESNTACSAYLSPFMGVCVSPLEVRVPLFSWLDLSSVLPAAFALAVLTSSIYERTIDLRKKLRRINLVRDGMAAYNKGPRHKTRTGGRGK